MIPPSTLIPSVLGLGLAVPTVAVPAAPVIVPIAIGFLAGRVITKLLK